MEHLLTHPEASTAVDRYLQKCKDVGFNVIELSSSFLSFPPEDWLRLVDKLHSYGLKAKPKLGIQFGLGGDIATEDFESTGTSDTSKVVQLGKRFVDAGVEWMMIESEGITENVKSWRTDIIRTIMKELPQEKVMFEGKRLV